MVPRRGLEPPWACAHTALNRACIPVSPPRHVSKRLYHSKSVSGMKNGGPKETRTPDPFHAMEVLYQLSYGPTNVISLLTLSRALPTACPPELQRRRELW